MPGMKRDMGGAAAILAAFRAAIRLEAKVTSLCLVLKHVCSHDREDCLTRSLSY